MQTVNFLRKRGRFIAGRVGQSFVVLTAGLVFLGSSFRADAAVATTESYNTNELLYAADVSNSDLLHGLTAVTTNWNSWNGASPATLNDGAHGNTYAVDIATSAAWTTPGAAATYDLGAGDGYGWDINSIQSIAAWAGGALGNQAYDVSVQFVNDSLFVALPELGVDYQPFPPDSSDAGATKVVLIDDGAAPLVSGIQKIRFAAKSVNGGAFDGSFFLREMDVFGVPSPVDETAPTVLSLSPSDESNEIRPHINLSLTFSEPVVIGAGNITIRNLDAQSQTAISVSNAQVSVSGRVLTINPNTALDAGSNYAVEIDVGAVLDSYGNPFAGITDSTTWNFTTGAAQPGRTRVFLLGGQSNMKGYGPSADLTAPYDTAQTNVAFWSNGEWVDLAPGFGTTSAAFGPEVSFGYTVQQALPSDRIYLIKYAENGTALYNDWSPSGGPQYSEFMSTARAALADLDAEGIDYEISGMLWLQGESDAIEGQGAAYETNLRNFIADMRTQFSRSDLPFYLARVRTHYGTAEQTALVRDAQVTVAETTDNVEWFDTDSYNPLISGGHYDAAGQISIGIDYATIYLATDPASNPLRIMCVGDSITVGYTDNPNWNVPFNFGYRSGLYTRLNDAGVDFTFVGTSPEPWNDRSGDPTLGGTVTPELDLREFEQDHHEGYGGYSISGIQGIITNRIAINHPDVILLMIGINGISSSSPAQLDILVGTIVSSAPDVPLIVAQITPKSSYNEDLYNYNTYIRETLVPAYAAAGADISTVDLYSLYLTDPADPTSIDSSLFSNGINHPSTDVYDQLAQEWFDGLWRRGLLDQPVGRLRIDAGTLLMDWNHKSGKIYNLRSSTNLLSSPLTWPIFGSYSNLVENSLSLPLSNDGSRFFVIEECDL